MKFSDGTPFTADDVVFSLNRANGPGSNMGSNFASVKEIKKVGDLRVEVTTKYPDPLLADKWAALGMMSKAWAEKNNARQLGRHDQERGELRDPQRHGHGAVHAQGAQGRRDARSWCRTRTGGTSPTHNLTEVIFTPVANPATRVAALKAGDIDMMYEVPPADTETLKKDANINVLEGPETRVIYLGMDQERDELLESNVKGKNPFKDKRVREAFHRSIDVDAIKRTVMRGQSFPTDLMVAPGINGYIEGARQAAGAAEAGRGQEDAGRCRLSATASRSAWIAPTTATSTTRRSARPSWRCWPASASR